jgi:predicted ABC-type ATPase
VTRPTLTIIAGSNGCGKSTLTSSARDKFQQTPILDPDAISKSLRQTLGSANSHIESGKQVLRLANEMILAKQSFTVETTLSGSTYLRMAQRAQEAGFNLLVVFIGTASVEINLQRVQTRVVKGGHDVPEEDQRRRYPRTLMNMKRLLPAADLAVILDNSADGHTMVGFGHRGTMHWASPLPDWVLAIKT